MNQQAPEHLAGQIKNLFDWLAKSGRKNDLSFSQGEIASRIRRELRRIERQKRGEK